MKLNRKELCNLILGISLDNLKQIEKNNLLKDRLKEKGYKFVRKEKVGRKNYYVIKQINNKQTIYNNICKYTYRTNKQDSFTNYFNLRTKEEIINKHDLANKTNVTTKTITKWDNNLIDKKIIAKDGYIYFYIDKEKEEIKECSKEEYNNFWKNKAYIKAFKNLELKYINGSITLTELQLASAEIGASISLIENKYYYRIKKFKTNTNNKLYIDTITLIKALYREDENKLLRLIEEK